MTEAQLKALIIANAQAQFDQLTALYTAINAGVPATVTAARAALQKYRDLESVLWDGLAQIKKQAQLAIDFGP
jgi:hypothetical protein